MPYAYTAPSQAVYAVGGKAYGASVAEGIGAAAGAAYLTYELATAKNLRATDYITGTYGILGAVFSGVPIVGPMLQTYSAIVGGAQYLNDTMKAKRKKDRIKREIRHAGAAFEASVARGYPSELAAFVSTRNLGQRWQHTLGVLEPIRGSGYHHLQATDTRRVNMLTRAQQFVHRPWVTDPETGELVTERELVARYGQYDRDVAASYELATRIAPARGSVPALLARRAA
jgi:hypothetical protein